MKRCERIIVVEPDYTSLYLIYFICFLIALTFVAACVGTYNINNPTSSEITVSYYGNSTFIYVDDMKPYDGKIWVYNGDDFVHEIPQVTTSFKMEDYSFRLNGIYTDLHFIQMKETRDTYIKQTSLKYNVDSRQIYGR